MILVDQHNQQQSVIAAQNDGSAIEKEILVPGNAVGFVIGKSGETIKSIQQRTITKITIDRDDDGTGQRHMQIRGYPLQVEAAYAEIMAIVAQHDAPARGAERSRKSNSGGVNPVSTNTPYLDPYFAYGSGGSAGMEYWQQFMQGGYMDPAALQAAGYDPMQFQQQMAMSYDPAALQAAGYDPAQIQAYYAAAAGGGVMQDPNAQQAYYAQPQQEQQQQQPDGNQDAPPPPE
eukprot:TRINITY_DN5830_c1_g1_i2.p1 TRINITY_DN5830_c1_g1~~TRINITY_DN5830_c1_g1_i2.p1  ORF type:complete len:232 (-),score=85.54 TRINITY_DN5830_c1_g1_i2:43-738(-)